MVPKSEQERKGRQPATRPIHDARFAEILAMFRPQEADTQAGAAGVADRYNGTATPAVTKKALQDCSPEADKTGVAPLQWLGEGGFTRLSEAARRLSVDPRILDRLAEAVEGLGLVGEERNAKLLYLVVTSRLLDRPLSLVIKGPTSVGKSFIVTTVLRTFPTSAYLDFTSMSPHALIYDDRPLAHRVVVLYEAAALGHDTPNEPNVLAYMIRSLLSEGRLRYTTVVRAKGGYKPRHIERKGPTGFVTTSTWTRLHPENETRTLAVSVRDDREQTSRVLVAVADRHRGQSGDLDLSPWHELQSWLERCGERRVVVPYARAVADHTSTLSLRMRRDLDKVLTAIQAHALLHQVNRERDTEGRIVATLEDYQKVYSLMNDVVAEAIEATVNPTVRETVNAVRMLQRATGGSPVTLPELARALNLDKASASRRARVARDHGYLLNHETQRGRPAQLVLGDPLPDEVSALPSPDALALKARTPDNTATLQHHQGLCRQDAHKAAVVPSATLLQHCNGVVLR